MLNARNCTGELDFFCVTNPFSLWIISWKEFQLLLQLLLVWYVAAVEDMRDLGSALYHFFRSYPSGYVDTFEQNINV